MGFYRTVPAAGRRVPGGSGGGGWPWPWWRVGVLPFQMDVQTIPGADRGRWLLRGVPGALPRQLDSGPRWPGVDRGGAASARGAGGADRRGSFGAALAGVDRRGSFGAALAGVDRRGSFGGALAGADRRGSFGAACWRGSFGAALAGVDRRGSFGGALAGVQIVGAASARPADRGSFGGALAVDLGNI